MPEPKFEKFKGNNIPEKKPGNDQYELDFDKNVPVPPTSLKIIKEDEKMKKREKNEEDINSEGKDVDDPSYLYHPNPAIVAELEEKARLNKMARKKI
ncbi:MAG: hypothetical protein WC249_01925 [Patescibacteria group bacterium]|jgi:hypothetical protein